MNGSYSSIRGKQQEHVSGDAKAIVSGHLRALGGLAGLLTKAFTRETDKLHNVLGTLNQSTAQFCQVVDVQGNSMKTQVKDLTDALNNAGKSSSKLSCVLIAVTVIGIVTTLFIGFPSAYKQWRELLGFQAAVEQSQSRQQLKKPAAPAKPDMEEFLLPSSPVHSL